MVKSGRITWICMAPTAAKTALYTHYCNVFVCYGCQRSFFFFYLRTDVDACDCTRWLYEYCKRVYTESRFWQKDLFNCLIGEWNPRQDCA